MGSFNVASDYLRAFASDQRGATAAEYVILLALIGSMLAMSILLLSGAISDGVAGVANLIDEAGCNNQGLGTGLGGGQGGGGGQGAGHGEGNTC